MMRTETLRSWQWAASGVLAKARVLTGRDILLVGLAGLSLALIGQITGRALHATWPIPASGSLAAALPRAVILLALLLRVRRFGVLTAAGLAEVAAKVAMGGIGLMPWCLIVPILGNLAGDVAWAGLGGLRSQRLRAALTGASLCTVRVLAALLFWATFMTAAKGNLGAIHGLIIGANVLLGLTAGFLVGRAAIRKRGEKDDPGE